MCIIYAWVYNCENIYVCVCIYMYTCILCVYMCTCVLCVFNVCIYVEEYISIHTYRRRVSAWARAGSLREHNTCVRVYCAYAYIHMYTYIPTNSTATYNLHPCMTHPPLQPYNLQTNPPPYTPTYLLYKRPHTLHTYLTPKYLPYTLTNPITYPTQLPYPYNQHYYTPTTPTQ